jgi:glycogen operon protein
MLAVGTPMFLMGDEVRRAQRGNNNAYCQDNEISWLDWNLCKQHADIHRFVRMMIAFRARRDVVIEDSRLSLNQLLQQARLEWHGVALHRPDWDEDSHSIALTVTSLRGHFTIHAMLNAYWEPLTFELPRNAKQANNGWRRLVDTSLQSPDDISSWDKAGLVPHPTYMVAPRSIVILVEAPESEFNL